MRVKARNLEILSPSHAIMEGILCRAELSVRSSVQILVHIKWYKLIPNDLLDLVRLG